MQTMNAINDLENAGSLTVREILAGDVRLASPPEIFLKISEIIDDPAKTVKDAEEVIKHDPGLAARLLRLVNSAFYGFPARIDSISHAISLIGMTELRDLVLATVIVDRFSKLPNKLMSMREFWRVSVRCALFARNLGVRHPQSRTLRAVYISALLHEIGRLVIYSRIPELARAALLLADSEGMEETEAERLSYGFDHYEVGSELAARWHLPEVFVETMKWHGQPEKAEKYPQETALTTVSSLLALKDIDSEEKLEEQYYTLEPFMIHLGMKENDIAAVLPEIDLQFEEVFQSLFLS
ncbi:MAG TPA: HDOD domain-containing protein [Methylothermaceae bacterium]|nr:HDOD domain-containing protein [Methylothermaceae bacterium]